MQFLETMYNGGKKRQIQWVAEHRNKLTSLSDDHSELVPLLPIPNRTVKRLRANDSVDYPCESRSSSDALQTKNPQVKTWGFFVCWIWLVDPVSSTGQALLERSENKSPSRRVACFSDTNKTNQMVGAKVGHRQTPHKTKSPRWKLGAFCFMQWIIWPNRSLTGTKKHSLQSII